ncbi:hypothetical protein [Mammaliicoccus sciuri]|uniref:hypothetical protein n=1 Tax=Mammaliicoccus sciuri TaxID=1296 RepID=UPI00066B8F57|nr:hypothetical protein [Mammaliicoccus sciuri]
MEEQILFLSGLGSHRLFLKDLNNQLDNLNLVQIDLPGHGLNLDVIVNDLNELVEWFKTWNQNLLEASTARMTFNLNKQVYELNINEHSILKLLQIRRQIKLPTFNRLIDRNVLVLLPQEQDQFILDMKIKNIASHIYCKTISDSGHDIYIDNPVKVGKEIKSWLSTINV